MPKRVIQGINLIFFPLRVQMRIELIEFGQLTRSLFQLLFQADVLGARRFPQNPLSLEFNGKAITVISVRLHIPDMLWNLFSSDSTKRWQFDIPFLLCMTYCSHRIINNTEIVSSVIQAIFTDMLYCMHRSRLHKESMKI